MITKGFKFENGDKVKEKVTGFEGIITGTVYYITGCNQYLITAKSQDGKEPVALWYDEGRLELLPSGSIRPEDVSSDDNGCDLLPNVGLKGA